MFQGYSRLLKVIPDFSGLLLTSGQGIIDFSDLFKVVACARYRFSFDFSMFWGNPIFSGFKLKKERMTQEGMRYFHEL